MSDLNHDTDMVIVGELPLLPPTERISSVITHRVASSEEGEIIQ